MALQSGLQGIKKTRGNKIEQANSIPPLPPVEQTRPRLKAGVLFVQRNKRPCTPLRGTRGRSLLAQIFLCGRNDRNFALRAKPEKSRGVDLYNLTSKTQKMKNNESDRICE